MFSLVRIYSKERCGDEGVISRELIAPFNRRLDADQVSGVWQSLRGCHRADPIARKSCGIHRSGLTKIVVPCERPFRVRHLRHVRWRADRLEFLEHLIPKLQGSLDVTEVPFFVFLPKFKRTNTENAPHSAPVGTRLNGSAGRK
jgi:hypothetical protein